MQKRVGSSSEAELAYQRELDACPLNLVSRKDLRTMGITYSNPHLLVLEREGRFPRRVMLSSARVAWVRCEIRAWIAARVNTRPGQGS